jgi:hypothetical protein
VAVERAVGPRLRRACGGARRGAGGVSMRGTAARRRRGSPRRPRAASGRGGRQEAGAQGLGHGVLLWCGDGMVGPRETTRLERRRDCARGRIAGQPPVCRRVEIATPAPCAAPASRRHARAAAGAGSGHVRPPPRPPSARAAAVPFVEREPVGQPGPIGQRLGVAEPDRVAQLAGVAHAQLQVLLADQPLLQHLTSSQNTGASKPWPQTWASSTAAVSALNHCSGQRAVGAQRARQRRGVQPLGGHRLQRGVEGREGVLLDRAAGRHRVAAEAQQHARVALGDEVERVAQVEARDRAPRALERPSAPRAKTKVGRCSRSFSRPATMPTTPSWKPGSNSAGGRCH